MPRVLENGSIEGVCRIGRLMGGLCVYVFTDDSAGIPCLHIVKEPFNLSFHSIVSLITAEYLYSSKQYLTAGEKKSLNILMNSEVHLWSKCQNVWELAIFAWELNNKEISGDIKQPDYTKLCYTGF